MGRNKYEPVNVAMVLISSRKITSSSSALWRARYFHKRNMTCPAFLGFSTPTGPRLPGSVITGTLVSAGLLNLQAFLLIAGNYKFPGRRRLFSSVPGVYRSPLFHPHPPK